MKHNYKVILILLGLFVISQYVGLFVVNSYMNVGEGGEVVYSDLPFGERPEVEENNSFVYLLVAVLIGTALLFGIIKMGAFNVWKAWFFLALFIALTTSFFSFDMIDSVAAMTLAFAFAIWRIYRPNMFVHNGTEPFVYAGIAAIFVSMLNLFSVSILLVLIAIYDAYAVWYSKHMIVLAKAQSKAGVFAGLLVPSSLGAKGTKVSSSKKRVVSKETKGLKGKVGKKRTKKSGGAALLGGGDIIFPLLFAAVLLRDFGLVAGLILPIFSTIGLSLLFYYSKKGKFYPAMPFLSAACFVGLGVFWLVGLI